LQAPKQGDIEYYALSISSQLYLKYPINSQTPDSLNLKRRKLDLA